MANTRSLRFVLVALGMTMLGACQADTASSSNPAETLAGPATPLDLSRDHLPGGDPGTVELADERELLPDLFAEENADRRVSVSGNLITDDAATTLRDRLDGAEVKVEVKTP